MGTTHTHYSIVSPSGEFWEDGYFVRMVGDKVTAEVIKRYICNHRKDTDEDLQLKLFDRQPSKSD